MPRHPPYALNSFINPTCNRHQTIASLRSGSRVGRYVRRPVEAPSSRTRGDAIGLMRHGQAPQTLALGVTFKKSATPKNLSNCQRALSLARPTTFSAAAGRASCCHFTGVTCCSARSRVGAGSESVAVLFWLSSLGNRPGEGRRLRRP